MTSSLNLAASLTEKYRPRTIEDFVGLPKPKKVLAHFALKPFASAWLFLGPSGIGKTSMALALTAAIPAELHHIPSRKCDLESLEETTRCCWYIPLGARFHLVLVDEADQMTPAAQLAFLSKLDATAAPPNTIFVFSKRHGCSRATLSVPLPCSRVFYCWHQRGANLVSSRRMEGRVLSPRAEKSGRRRSLHGQQYS